MISNYIVYFNENKCLKDSWSALLNPEPVSATSMLSGDSGYRSLSPNDITHCVLSYFWQIMFIWRLHSKSVFTRVVTCICFVLYCFKVCCYLWLIEQVKRSLYISGVWINRNERVWCESTDVIQKRFTKLQKGFQAINNHL